MTNRAPKIFKPLLAALSVLALVHAGDSRNLSVARNAPAWLRDGVIYEIFPRDFSTAGDLNGITAQLDRMKELGVTIIWTMPIHPIGEKFRKGKFGSPYSIRDFYTVDANYGTVEDYKRLVADAHRRGMKVIMDLVACHTSWDSVMMDHPDFYKHDATGKMIPPVPEWTDVAALDYANPALRQYMIDMLKYWIQTCDVDGFRCDSAAMVPTDFWEQTRVELEKTKPDIILLAEASKPELLVKAFDIDYSWPLLGALNDVIAHGKPASNLRRCWEDSQEQFPKDALHLQISDDHDERRAVARYGLDGAMAASVLTFTLDGVPLLYNGMEAGDTAESSGDALFNKSNISWNPKATRCRELYHEMIRLRHQYPALRHSTVDWLHNSDEARVVTYRRADAHDEFVVMINLSKNPFAGKVFVDDPQGFAPVKLAGIKTSDAASLAAINLDGYEWRIYHRTLK